MQLKMGVSNILFCSGLILLLATAVLSHGGACLQDGRHKATPTPEPGLKKCSMYSRNSCCSVTDVQDLFVSENSRWDKCGVLSPLCESFLKRVVCFYRCSPDVARWPHPQQSSALKAVPLCHSFCRDWYDACRVDLTCARDWTRDPRGQNCSGACVPYQQMYQHGRDLCESLFGDAFMTVEDAPAEDDDKTPVKMRKFRCLTLTSLDSDVIAAQSNQENQPDATKVNTPGKQSPAAPPLAWRKNNGNSVLHKRSVIDTEGSGSGF